MEANGELWCFRRSLRVVWGVTGLSTNPEARIHVRREKLYEVKLISRGEFGGEKSGEDILVGGLVVDSQVNFQA